jgi:hypothetical protein
MVNDTFNIVLIIPLEFSTEADIVKYTQAAMSAYISNFADYRVDTILTVTEACSNPDTIPTPTAYITADAIWHTVPLQTVRTVKAWHTALACCDATGYLVVCTCRV